MEAENPSNNFSKYLSINWIVNPRYDLFFFVGSCIFTFMFYGIYRFSVYLGYPVNGASILITYFIFTAIFDHPHIFQTFSRIHQDKEEFHRRPYLYTIGLASFIIAGLVVTGMGYIKEMIVVAAIFGFWHVVRQHYGFLRAYKRVNGDFSRIDNYLDSITFYTGMLACFLNNFADSKPVMIYGDLYVKFPTVPDETGVVCWWIFCGLLAVFVLRQIQRISEGKPINLPKILFLVSSVFTHYFVFFATDTAFLVAESLETASHTVQYQGWMMRYQNTRYPEIKHIALKWFAVSMIYGIIVGTIEIYGLLSYTWAMWVFVPFSMIVLFHYLVDGFIWKFRYQKELAPMLARG